MAAEIPGERDCLIGLAPKYDAKETARQAAIEALQQRRFLDAADCAKVYASLCLGVEEYYRMPFIVRWVNKEGSRSYMLFNSRKNAERFASHIGSFVENH